MSSKIAIYTSIFGNYDDLPEITYKPKILIVMLKDLKFYHINIYRIMNIVFG
jgi:hypothetical protein